MSCLHSLHINLSLFADVPTRPSTSKPVITTSPRSSPGNTHPGMKRLSYYVSTSAHSRNHALTLCGLLLPVTTNATKATSLVEEKTTAHSKISLNKGMAQ